MTAVCMGCLEGWTGNGIVCRFCLKPWTGGHLILGTMYSYDIFAAMPCCQKRFQVSFCKKVHRLLNSIPQYLQNFEIFSHSSATRAVNWCVTPSNPSTFFLTILRWFHVPSAEPRSITLPSLCLFTRQKMRPTRCRRCRPNKGLPFNINNRSLRRPPQLLQERTESIRRK